MNYILEIGNYSDIGKARKINEDYFGSFSGRYGTLLIVCDGMGGHEGGEIASRLAVETINNHFEHLGSDFNPKEELIKAIEKANFVIIEAGKTRKELAEMGSTVVMALIKDDFAYTANLGDSRIYLIKNGSISQITKDHSLVQQMIDSDLISPEEAQHHPKKNVITKALGIEDNVEPEIIKPFKLTPNDCLILCTDGLTNHVNDEEILALCISNSSQDAAEKLVDLANERGGTDNITVQILKVHERKSPVKGNGISKSVYLTLSVIIITAALYALFALNIFNLGNNELSDGETPVTGNKPEVTHPGTLENTTLEDSSTVKAPDSAKVILNNNIKEEIRNEIND